jgi:hypothetical protein
MSLFLKVSQFSKKDVSCVKDLRGRNIVLYHVVL